MVFLKLLLALPRLAVAIFKLALKFLSVLAVLGFIFGTKVALGIMVVLTFFWLLTFINNLFSVLTEDIQYTKSSNVKSFDDDDYWTPGQPAVSQKAYEQGFFQDH
ncbi:MAG: hypothetical protein QM504_12000 [Pseudomonadota bacterium]